MDPEGDLLTYHVVKKPARGAVTVQEDGTFVYTPYENKTGKDTSPMWRWTRWATPPTRPR